jgi:hypothetical protein
MFFGFNDVAFLAAASAAGLAPGLDPDAAAYITAVETADTQELEQGVRDAINDFVVGCKADGIWNAIKASCILAGARTLEGALVPLVGTAPTNFNFVSGDYNRKTGLVGNGSTKYLDSNRNNNADPQNDSHNAVWLSSLGTGTVAYMGAGLTQSGVNTLINASGFVQSRNRTASSFQPGVPLVTGLYAASRSISASYVVRNGGANLTDTRTSETPFIGNVFVFARGTTGSPSLPTNARLAFYSIGESLDLAQLDTRVTALINAFDAAIA